MHQSTLSTAQFTNLLFTNLFVCVIFRLSFWAPISAALCPVSSPCVMLAQSRWRSALMSYSMLSTSLSHPCSWWSRLVDSRKSSSSSPRRRILRGRLKGEWWHCTLYKVWGSIPCAGHVQKSQANFIFHSSQSTHLSQATWCTDPRLDQ